MSHFAVLVIGSDVEKQLAPFDENSKAKNSVSKWDWWVVGGRYRDRFPVKVPELAVKGEGMEKYVGSLYVKPEKGFGDIALKRDIDWKQIHRNSKDYQDALRFWDMKVNGSVPVTEKEKEEIKWDWYKPEYYLNRYKTAVNYANCDSSFTMWAYVKDGEWFEKGNMGWFACSDESDEDAVKWELEFYDNVIRPLKGDTLLTVVDCHI